MPANPLIEVFGYPAEDMSEAASRARENRLCPFGNPSSLHCTKSSAINPLGVCSILDGTQLAVTCPVRLRQDNLFLADAGAFFFSGRRFVALTEVRLNDHLGKSAGNIDVVLAVLDEEQNVIDFGAIELQAVYISGNVGAAFAHYMQNPSANYRMEWPRKNYPSPDYLSSSRKRLVPQLMFKGGILHSWKKKIAVVVHKAFFNQLPHLTDVDSSEADIAWLVYDLQRDPTTDRFIQTKAFTKYTKFEAALNAIAVPVIGEMDSFVQHLEKRIKNKAFRGTLEAPSTEPTVEPMVNPEI